MDNIKVSISKKVFNPVYLPYLNNEDRRLIFYGGAGSGKSYYVAERYVKKIMEQIPCNIMVVRNKLNSQKDSAFALMKQIIHKWGVQHLFKINESHMTITCLPNGNQIVFKGLEDVERLKSVTFTYGDLTDVWIEEASEVTYNDYAQLNIRLRGLGTKKQIILTFNPIDINHWIKKKLIDTGKSTVVKTTYKDNKFLDDEYKEELESFAETDPYYYDVYCLGNWGVYGNSVFDKNVKQIMDI